MKRFAPDMDEVPTLEIPDFRRKAQFLLQLLTDYDISPQEYVERLEIVETALREIYQEAATLTRIQTESQVQTLRERLDRATRRPAKTNPSMVPPPPKAPGPAIHIAPNPVPDLEMDWTAFDDEKK